MAQVLQVQATVTGANVYAIIRDTFGCPFILASNTFDTSYGTASLANYPVPMTEMGTASRCYKADFPVTITRGNYYVTYFVRAGGSPAETDTIISSDSIQWSGTGFVLWDDVVAALELISTADDARATSIIDTISIQTGQILANTDQLTFQDGFVTASTQEISPSAIDAIYGAMQGLVNADTYGEPGPTDPLAITTLADKIGFLYKAFRNRKVQSSTEMQLFGDDDVTVHQTADITAGNTEWSKVRGTI